MEHELDKRTAQSLVAMTLSACVLIASVAMLVIR
jgi:hypothetical protein